MNKFITVQEAVAKIEDGMTIMVGGFLAVGTPISVIDALAEKGVKNLYPCLDRSAGISADRRYNCLFYRVRCSYAGYVCSQSYILP